MGSLATGSGGAVAIGKQDRHGAGGTAGAAVVSESTASGTGDDGDVVDLLEQPQTAQIVGPPGEILACHCGKAVPPPCR